MIVGVGNKFRDVCHHGGQGWTDRTKRKPIILKNGGFIKSTVPGRRERGLCGGGTEAQPRGSLEGQTGRARKDRRAPRVFNPNAAQCEAATGRPCGLKGQRCMLCNTKSNTECVSGTEPTQGEGIRGWGNVPGVMLRLDMPKRT